jgi:steroid 5-alpha reductase family enzyme
MSFDPSLSAAWETLRSQAPGPLLGCAEVMAGAIALCWLLQTVTRNYSWVDRLWSVLPPVYVTLFTWNRPDPRLWLMLGLSTLWGARLTFNFARKGGYDPREEDYRWAHVRSFLEQHDPLHPLGRELFSFGFIALYQHVLIALFTVPAAWVAWRSDAPLGALDGLCALAFLALLGAETLTDQQQWTFQRAKHALTPEQRAQAGGDFARGFCTTGVFRYSRHLNFFGEMGLWWAFYAFTAAAGAPAANWTATGPVLLTLLFQGSTAMTERLSLQKYPAYRDYQQTTSRLIPMPPRGGLSG